MEINHQLDNRIMQENEDLLDDEENLLDYVRVMGTASLRMDAINWYFKDLIETMRNYRTEGERAEADRRIKGLMNALLLKEKTLRPDKKKRDDFLCFDAVTQIKAETLNETAKDCCELFCNGRRKYGESIGDSH
jgi:hypothetical protein